MVKIDEMDFPLDRKYYIRNGSHIWLKTEGNLIKIGLDAFAAKMTVSIEYLIVNKGQFKNNDVIGIFESNKFVSKLHSPIQGEVIDVNSEVVNNPLQINNHPYDSWIVTIKPDSKSIEGKYIIEGKSKITNWISKEIERIKNKI